ncbi:MAG: hypothetical protein UT55_C0085G0005 [Candidatus Peregrinibacteria bacterium GW2011_GWE2_39_6]|nr:MAG: hypothetical protein UT36_C0005G0071 [Candidatus Peregrinibacteria bacterium GW2011_GWF2_39_17]KKR23680.1 MAG: hypothetical protein UT55_C0085G0005 [Candidatus Peregrinibacteria bacterium GW2011_GWE2_39_6]
MSTTPFAGYDKFMNFPIDLPNLYLKKAKTLQIKPVDIKESFIRGSGHGGQKINKTASCVWLKHRPTSIEVKVQRHREQSKNRISAYKLLIDKIEISIKGEKSEHAQKIFKIRKQKQRRSKKTKEKLLKEKKHRSELKSLRSNIINSEN